MKKEVITSFFYFFSANAQVLAAFLALSGIFVIFVLKITDRKILEHARFIEKSMRKFMKCAGIKELKDDLDTNIKIEKIRPVKKSIDNLFNNNLLCGLIC
jgi:hypothetical protein